MERKNFYYYLLGIFGLLFIGFLIMVTSFNGYNYYQKQNYNNLQSFNNPEPIQHYKEQVDNFNEKTEENDIAEKTNITINNQNINQTQPSIFEVCGMRLICKNGTPNILWMGVIAYLIWFKPLKMKVFGIKI